MLLKRFCKPVDQLCQYNGYIFVDLLDSFKGILYIESTLFYILIILKNDGYLCWHSTNLARNKETISEFNQIFLMNSFCVIFNLMSYLQPPKSM